MKSVKNILLFSAIALFAACESDMENAQIANPKNFVAPVMNNVGDVIVNQDNSDAETVVFSWSAADYGLPVEITYQVYLSYNANSALVGSTTSTTLAVSKGDLNGVVINDLGVDPNETVAISAYVTSQISGAKQYDELVSSSSNMFNVSTFQAALKNWYLCGNYTGSWDIANATELWETGGGTNTFAGMVDFNDGGAALSYFKVTSGRNWSGNNYGFNYLTPGWGNLDPDQGDSNLSIDISSTTIWTVEMKTTVMTIDAEPIGNVISLTGSFNGWAQDNTCIDLTYDYTTGAFTATADLTAGDEVKLFVDKKWDINWGVSGKTSSAIAGGLEMSKGGGNITIAVGGTRTIKFYTNRTPYVLVIE